MSRVAPALTLVALLSVCPACELSVYSTTSASAAAGPAAPLPPSPLPGWVVEGEARASYEAVADADAPRDGHPTIRLHPTRDAGHGYATFMTSLDAAPLRGRRAHAIVWVRTQGVTGRGDVWLRAQAADSPPDGAGLASSAVRLAPSGDFTRYELTIEVPVDAAHVQLGVGLGGPGVLWMDGVKVEAL